LENEKPAKQQGFRGGDLKRDYIDRRVIDVLQLIRGVGTNLGCLKGKPIGIYA
jgi:hypothetical protein